MEPWGVDALLITNPVDIRYLTGFSGDDSWAVVPGGGGPVTVVSDFRFREQLQREAPQVVAVMRHRGLAETLAALADRRGYQRLAVPAGHVTLAQRRALSKALGGGRLKPVDEGLLRQRAVKDDAEVASIVRALRIQQEAFGRTARSVRAGQSEFEVAGRLEYEMRRLGADGPSFPTIVAAGANASLPHASPGGSRVRRPGLVLFDWGARCGGYCGDLTRVLVLGRLSPQLRQVYAIVREAQQAAIAAIAPGRPLAGIDKVARDLIARAGYRRHFGHSLGHGVGLAIHEQPVLGARSKGDLEPGHVVTVEPGIYLPGVGGVRIEDVVLVTARGHRVLSDLPSDLASAII
jgi:Xaa-Pro aminopeptidase